MTTPCRNEIFDTVSLNPTILSVQTPQWPSPTGAPPSSMSPYGLLRSAHCFCERDLTQLKALHCTARHTRVQCGVSTEQRTLSPVLTAQWISHSPSRQDSCCRFFLWFRRSKPKQQCAIFGWRWWRPRGVSVSVRTVSAVQCVSLECESHSAVIRIRSKMPLKPLLLDTL